MLLEFWHDLGDGAEVGVLVQDGQPVVHGRRYH